MNTNHKEPITNKQIANIVTGSFFAVSLLSSLILSSSSVSADDVVDIINITVPVSCTLSGTGQGTHNETIENGTYESNIGTTTIKAFCNDNTGFAIYAAGYTGDEIGGTNSNKLVGASTNQTIVTGTATTAGNPDVSNWAMKLGTVTNPTPAYPITITTGYNDYHTVPNEYTKVAYRNASTDIGSSAEGATLTTTYAAYISKTQAADTYSGKVIYTLVHPATAPAPLVCKPNGTTISTIACMQDISSTNESSILASMTQGTAYLLYDSRDEQQYHVAKLADGNIWMLDNLALDPTDPTTASKMNASNTNASAEAITNLLNGGNAGNNAGWSSTAVADVDTGFDDYTAVTDVDTGFDDFTAPMINNASKDTVVTSYGAGSGKVGIYYNYCAASASTYCYAQGQGVDVPNTDIDAPQDICPANWRMPTGGDYDDSTQTGSGEYYALGTALGLTFDEDAMGFIGTTYQTALSTSLSGYYEYLDISAYGQGIFGNWWSSTYYDGELMYDLSADSSYVDPVNYNARQLGFTMRCLMGS
ncbi:hypothetical protein IKD49_03110 [Candidatus Saccharibacteria bacterium]|nr:hypothetical protein [Candidatus Saccharibacteria bacterium]